MYSNPRRPCPATPNCTASPTSASSPGPQHRRSWSSAPTPSATRPGGSPTSARVAGVVRAHLAAKAYGLPLVVGSEIALEDGPRLVLLAEDREGYRQPLGADHHRPAAARPRATTGWAVPTSPTACRTAPPCGWRTRGPTPRKDGGSPGCSPSLLDRGRAAPRRGRPPRLAHRRALAQATGLPLVATGGVLMHERARQPLQDVLTAVASRRPRRRGGPRPAAQCERHLRQPRGPRPLLPRRAAGRDPRRRRAACTSLLDELRYEYPAELVAGRHTPTSPCRADRGRPAHALPADGGREGAAARDARELR